VISHFFLSPPKLGPEEFSSGFFLPVFPDPKSCLKMQHGRKGLPNAASRERAESRNFSLFFRENKGFRSLARFLLLMGQVAAPMRQNMHAPLGTADGSNI
jgi:hypothetical protein